MLGGRLVAACRLPPLISRIGHPPSLPPLCVQTGQRGCAPRVDSNFLLPIPLCYVRNPGACISAFPVGGSGWAEGAGLRLPASASLSAIHSSLALTQRWPHPPPIPVQSTVYPGAAWKLC